MVTLMQCLLGDVHLLKAHAFSLEDDLHVPIFVYHFYACDVICLLEIVSVSPFVRN